MTVDGESDVTLQFSYLAATHQNSRSPPGGLEGILQYCFDRPMPSERNVFSGRVLSQLWTASAGAGALLVSECVPTDAGDIVRCESGEALEHAITRPSEVRLSTAAFTLNWSSTRAAQAAAHPDAQILPSVPASSAFMLPRAVFYDFYISVSRGQLVCQPADLLVRAEDATNYPRSDENNVRSCPGAQDACHGFVIAAPEIRPGWPVRRDVGAVAGRALASSGTSLTSAKSDRIRRPATLRPRARAGPRRRSPPAGSFRLQAAPYSVGSSQWP